MKTYTKYLYSFPNATLTLKVIEYLSDRYQIELKSVAVINLIDCWLVKIHLQDSIGINLVKNLQAVLQELGFPYQPSPLLKRALTELENGVSPIKIMNQYRIVIVTSGKPDKTEIELFREQIVERLGYYPQNMI